MMNQHSLEKILSGLQQKDRSTFDYLFDEYSYAMYQIAVDVVKDKEIARDVVQEAFLNLWEKAENIQIQTSVKSYLLRTATNLAINRLKKETRLQEKHSDQVFHVAGSRAEYKVEEKEFEQQVYLAINTLPPQCKRVFTLSRFNDMPPQEIATSLNISINTVYTHLTMALRVIKDNLKKKKIF